MTTPKSPEEVAGEWLYQGGGGVEIDKGDEKAFTCTFDGLVSILASYAEQYEARIKELEDKDYEHRNNTTHGYCRICDYHGFEKKIKSLSTLLEEARGALEWSNRVVKEYAKAAKLQGIKFLPVVELAERVLQKLNSVKGEK